MLSNLWKPEDRYNFALRMFSRNPKGFRAASKHPLETTWLEQLAILAGITSPPKRTYSKRGLTKFKAKLQFITAYKANPRNTMSNWERQHA
jgi:hypothetical protein